MFAFWRAQSSTVNRVSESGGRSLARRQCHQRADNNINDCFTSTVEVAKESWMSINKYDVQFNNKPV
jgi:hypothetical protein